MDAKEIAAYLEANGLKVVPNKVSAPHIKSAKYNANGTLTLVVNLKSKSELGEPTAKGNISIISGYPIKFEDLKYAGQPITLNVSGWIKAK